MREEEKKPNQRIIGVVSGKGGVGKSVFAINTAAVLTKLGDQCVLVDADLGNPSVGLHLGLSYTNISLQDALSGKHHVSDSIVIQPTTGMRLLPASLKYSSGNNLKNLSRVLNSLTAYDYVLVDSPPGLTDSVEQIINACDELVIITTPDIPSVTSAAKVAALCKKRGKRVAGIVVNRVINASFELSTREIESMTEASVLTDIPEDKSVPASIASRLPLVLSFPRSIAAQKFKLAALSLSGQPNQSGLAPPGAFDSVLNIFQKLLRL